MGRRYADLLEGSYDCADRIVRNAHHTLCYAPPGFRYWWRQLAGSDATLDNAHFMRLAGRFSRRVHGFAKAHGITVVGCLRGGANASASATSPRSIWPRTRRRAGSS